MKRTIFIVIILAIAFGGWYAYKEYNRTNVDLADVKPEASLSAADLIRSFESDSASANKKYLGKILAVSGQVKSIERDGNSATVILGDKGSMSSVRCSMDTTHIQEIASLKEGQGITIKGNCTGFNQDELLGSDVILNRCAVAKP